MANPSAQPLTVADLLEVVKLQNGSAFTKDDLAMLIQEMKKPFVDVAAQEREKREASKTKRDMEQMRAIQKQAQNRCSHKYKKSGVWAISPIHNYPDRQTRAVCNLCRKYFEPQHVEIGFGDVRTVVAEDPQYHIVREIEAEAAYELVG